MQLSDYVQTVYCLDREISTGSQEQYLIAATHFSASLEPPRPATIADLSDASLRKCLAEMLAAKKSRVTANKTRRSLLALARHAKRRGLTDYRPDVEALPEKREAPRAWTIDQLSRLIQAASAVPVWGKTLRAMLLIYYDTGIRARDVLAIRRKDCDLAQRILILTERKTRKRRVFEVSPQAAMAIDALSQDAEFVVPYAFVTFTPLRKALRKALVAAGLPTTRKDLFQKIRRTAATQASAAGEDATVFLGHSAKWVTDTFYIDTTALAPTRVSANLPRPTIKDVAPAVVPVREVAELLAGEVSTDSIRLGAQLLALTLKQLASKVGVSESYLHETLTRGRISPRLQQSVRDFFQSWLDTQCQCGGVA